MPTPTTTRSTRRGEPDALANLDSADAGPSYAMENGVATAPAAELHADTHVSGKTIERFVPRARNEMGDWCFWIVATDTAGNRSEPSRMLRGRALQPPPLPPVWVSATRNGSRIDLDWTYPAGAQGYAEDPRWASLVERSSARGGFWASVSPWLPRGEYSCSDAPPLFDADWDYRLQVRDQFGTDVQRTTGDFVGRHAVTLTTDRTEILSRVDWDSRAYRDTIVRPHVDAENLFRTPFRIAINPAGRCTRRPHLRRLLVFMPILPSVA